MPDLRVLVTGGAGFIGSHVVDTLVAEGCAVVVLDDLSNGRRGNLATPVVNGQVELVEGSVVEAQDVAMAMRGVDAVVHLAAVVSVPQSVADPEATYETNVFGTKMVLDQCVAHGIRQCVFASTCAVYGEACYTPIDELHGTDPISPYAESKLVAEQMLLKDYDDALATVALRLFNVYGRRQPPNGEAGVITVFKDRLLTDQPVVVYGDGWQTRDFIHIDDVAYAIWRVLNAEVTGVFNLCSGQAVTIRQLAAVMAELAGRGEVAPRFTTPRAGDIRHSHGTYAKARAAFGFEPMVPLRRGLRDLLDAEPLDRTVAYAR